MKTENINDYTVFGNVTTCIENKAVDWYKFVQVFRNKSVIW